MLVKWTGIELETENPDNKYLIFYRKQPTFDEKESKETFEKSYFVEWQYLGYLKAANLGEAFNVMQGEIWSPKGQANYLIEQLGLTHTSMSVGDIVQEINGNTYICANNGWLIYDNDFNFIGDTNE